MPPSRRTRRPGAKLLGLDLGERRIGVSITDDTGILASPLEIVDLRYQGLDRVVELARAHGVAGIVAGLPRTMAGAEGFQAKRSREQADQLRELTDLPIILWDERLTTAMADQILSGSGKKRRSPQQRRKERDALAAAILLQDYINANPVR